MYQTLVCGSERFLILEFSAVNVETGLSFLEWSREMLTLNGVLTTEVWVGLEVGGPVELESRRMRGVLCRW